MRPVVICCLLVFVGFTLTSTTWIEWLYHLMAFVSPESADSLTLVGGYLCQAVGLGIAALIAKGKPHGLGRGIALSAVVLHVACAFAALASQSIPGTLTFGYLMNMSCGFIAAFYLDRLAQCVPENRRGITFGGGYACSIIVTWLISLARDAVALPLAPAIPLILVLAIAMAALAAADPGTRPAKPESQAILRIDRRLVALACAIVLLMSLVKNMGFSFPAADIQAGLSLEYSRLFYAAGLLVAGIVMDHNRKYGAICCTIALVTPFALMALSGEPIPGITLWAVDYFFFGFFSVFRIVLFADIAARDDLLFLAGFGLLFGRVGDALGTALCLALAGNTAILVVAAAALFALTVFTLFHLFNRFYQQDTPVETAPAKSDQQVFEEFSAHYDLSSREREVLRCVLTESTNAEIASALFISESTVKFHVRNLLKKTGTTNRQELRAAYALHARE